MARVRRTLPPITERLGTEIAATVELVDKNIVHLTAEQREQLRFYLIKLATIAGTRTVLARSEQEAIENLCAQVLQLAADEPAVATRDTLRSLVRAISLGDRVYHSKFAPKDSGESQQSPI